ncbi:MAG TPA: hypothetical protein VEJ46_12135 [Candidatus Acidoferrum sp.]|nr:hypothetical protein [Candidatus Acidoferrum sp.]
MKLSIAATLLLAGIAGVASRGLAQQTPVWPCDEKCQEAKQGMLYAGRSGTVMAYSVAFLGRGLVVSPTGKRFLYRGSWGYDPTRKKFKESDLKKIEKRGVQVIRLAKGATDDDVQVAIVKHAQAQKTPGQVVTDGPMQFR